MSKKSIIAILSAVVLMVVASLALVFTMGPMTSAADETIYDMPTEYLNLTNDGKTLGDNSWRSGNAFNAAGEAWIKEYAKYRVEIPAGVTSISDSAFDRCTGLTSITIPSSVTSIGGSAFRGCSGLTSITIPEGVTSIGGYAFGYCSGLMSITIPSSVTSIGNYAFDECSGLTSITIPEGVTSIGNYAFRNCSGLTSITIPAGVTSIGVDAFWNCSGLTSVTFAENSQLTSIERGAFSYCSGLTSITIPAGVSSIGNAAFENCSGLTSITIPEGVTSIGEYAFSGCSGLTSITIPEGVTSIGYDAFRNCSGLNEIIVRNEDLLTNANLRPYASKLHYGAEQNTISFVTNCDTTIDDRLIDFGEVTTEPTSLTKEHYTFAGWYSDKQYTKPFTFDTPIKYDITLWAKWEINKYNVIFDSNGGNAVAPQRNVEYNTLLTVPETPTREGYNFLGWYNGDEAYDFTTPVSQDMTLTAKWEAVQAQPEPETPDEETSTEVNNQNNNGLLWGILGTSGGILLVGGIVFGIVIAKRRRK